MADEAEIIKPDDLVLVTGAAGFIGARVVSSLLDKGFLNIRCLDRDSSDTTRLKEAIDSHGAGPRSKIVLGNLLSRMDCSVFAKDAVLIYHLAAGTDSKEFSEAYMNSVVTTRNLLDAAIEQKCMKRFVSMSSFSVYTNRNNPRWRLLDESCPIEPHPESRAEAYCFAKAKQDELVMDYGKRLGVPWILLRPGTVYGPGKRAIPGRVGLDTFGFFLHLGGPNHIPFSYVDNCAEAIVMAGLKPGIEGEAFNIVDDDLPSSRRFLRLYKRHVRSFKSVYVPHALSYLFCLLWEKYSSWSHGQLPPVFSRREWSAYWKKTRYSNRKIKEVVGWSPRISTEEGLRRFFESCKGEKTGAQMEKTTN